MINISDLYVGDWVQDKNGIYAKVLGMENWSNGYFLNIELHGVNVGVTPLASIHPIPITPVIKRIIFEICLAKRQQRIHPVLATEIEIKHELMRKGVELTASAWSRIAAALSEDEDIIMRRLLRYNGYELKTTHDANIAETDT